MYKHLNANPVKEKYERLMCDPNYICQEKLKGIRAFLHIHPDRNIITTRGGKDATDKFPHIRDWVFPVSMHDYVLDGELFERGVEDEVIAGYANRKYISASEVRNVRFYAFDILTAPHDITQRPLQYRLEELGTVFDANPIEDAPIEFLPCYPITEAETLYASVIANGGEGIMLKNVNVDYAQRSGDNRPQGYWYKVKGVDEFDVVLLDTVPALPGKFEGLAGAVTYGMYVDGKLHALGNCTGMSDRMRWSITHEFETKWKFRVMRVIAQKQDENSGALIEPRFADDRPRIDKLPEECVWAR